MSTYRWTLTDTSETADSHGAPLAEGTAGKKYDAISDGRDARVAAIRAAGIYGTLSRQQSDVEGAWFRNTYADGTVLTVHIEPITT